MLMRIKIIRAMQIYKKHMTIVLTTALGLAIAAGIYLGVELNRLKNEISDLQLIIAALQRQTEKDSKIIRIWGSGQKRFIWKK